MPACAHRVVRPQWERITCVSLPTMDIDNTTGVPVPSESGVWQQRIVSLVRGPGHSTNSTVMACYDNAFVHETLYLFIYGCMIE